MDLSSRSFKLFLRASLLKLEPFSVEEARQYVIGLVELDEVLEVEEEDEPQEHVLLSRS